MYKKYIVNIPCDNKLHELQMMIIINKYLIQFKIKSKTIYIYKLNIINMNTTIAVQ